MANLLKLIRAKIFLIILTLLSLYIFIPTFDIKFSWIDDGWNIMLAKDLLVDISQFDLESIGGRIIESNIGRFRPVYWIWQTSIYILGGSNSSIHYFLHYILIISIVFLTYKIIYHFSKSHLSGFIGSVLLLVFPLNAENWVRLGPQEPLMVLFILLSLYGYFLRKNIRLSIVYMVLAFLTKETAIAVVPGIVVYSILLRITKKRDKLIVKYIFWLIVISLASLVISLLNRKGYSSSYVFDIKTTVYNFELYLGFIKNAFRASIFFVMTLLIRNIRPIINFKFKKISEYELVKIMFLSLFFLFILIQAPWAWVLSRYLLPAIVMGSIYIGLEFNSIVEYLDSHKYLKKAFYSIFCVYFIFFSISSIIKINEQIVRQKHSTNNVYLMLKRLSEVTPVDGKVYFNFVNNDATYEPLFESDLHFKLFFNRSDILVDFIENKPKNEANYLVISGTPLGSFPYLDESNFKKDKLIKNKETYKNDNKFVVLSNLETVSKQVSKKIYHFITTGNMIDRSGIYTDYLLKDTWGIYYY